ncbi:MAG: response regulator [Verrucomicrobia bacterium]|nr:response regulator [Verrucomicrobiota bacterium]
MKTRILLVDDELDFTGLLQFRLAEWGHEIIVAATGMEGLNQAREHQPDVILTDLVLPDLDGLTLCEILRRQPWTQATPVIMITATANVATRYSARAAGVRDFLPKPLDFERLKHSLETVLAMPAPQATELYWRRQRQDQLAGWLDRAVVLRGAYAGGRPVQLDDFGRSTEPIAPRVRPRLPSECNQFMDPGRCIAGNDEALIGAAPTS